MTRINCDLDPVELMDQHLMAEYRELPMVYAALQRSLQAKRNKVGAANSVDVLVKCIPKSFTLNTGHVTFFYDKLFFLHKRYQLLIEELKRRDFRLDPNRVYSLVAFPAQLKNDWEATERDRDIIRARIKEKIAMKPHWYRYCGKSIV